MSCWVKGLEEIVAIKRNGRNSNLEVAMTLLIQNQAQAAGEMAQIRRDFEEIKRILLRHEQLLVRHEQLLANLPEAIRQKIGFKE